MTKKNKITDLKQKKEEKLFDNHMTTMYALLDELLERDEEDLTEAENNFIDALLEWNNFLCDQEEE